MANIAPFLPGLGLGALASGVGIAVVGYSEGSVKFEKKIISSSAEIISNYRELSCVKDLFPTVTWHAYPKNEDAKKKITENGNPKMALEKDKTEGCISIRWQKETYSSGSYWRGAWNLIWVMKDDNHGTIFMSTITADYGVVQIDKYFYALEKKGDKWETIGKWFKDKETVTKDNQNTFIVPLKESLPEPNNNLVDFDINLDNVCSNTKTCYRSSAHITVADLNWKYQREGSTESDQNTEKQWNQKVSKWIKDRNVVDFELKDIYKNNTGRYELGEVFHSG